MVSGLTNPETGEVSVLEGFAVEAATSRLEFSKGSLQAESLATQSEQWDWNFYKLFKSRESSLLQH
jgi:hypothetical protein